MIRTFNRCNQCGFVQEDALEMSVCCDGCGLYDWSEGHQEDDGEMTAGQTLEPKGEG